MSRTLNSRFVTLASVAALWVASAASLSAGPLEDAQAAYKRRDFETALKLLVPLADRGDAEAQTLLALMYENGWGVLKDDVQALNWFRRAADQGNAQAEYKVGNFYQDGIGVAKDSAEMAKWHQLAADQGYLEALQAEGFMHAFGVGVPKDYLMAYVWYERAVLQGSKEAIENRDRIASKLSPDQIAEAQKLAREWKPRHRG